MLRQPEVVNVAVVAAVFFVLASFLVVWSQDQIKVVHGQIMTENRVTRLDYDVEDELRTEQARRAARERVPHVFRPNTLYLEALRPQLMNLPVVVAGQGSLDAIDPGIRGSFALDGAALKALSRHSSKGKPTDAWRAWVANLLDRELISRPVIDNNTWQQELLRPTPRFSAPGSDIEISWFDAIPIHDGTVNELRLDLERVVMAAGFPERVTRYIAARLTNPATPTFLLDEELTEHIASRAANIVAPIKEVHHRGEPIYLRGDRLSTGQFEQLSQEAKQFRGHASFGAIWWPRLGVIGLIATIAAFLGGYLIIFYPKVSHNALRVGAIVALLLAMLASTVLLAEAFPKLIYPAAVAPTLLAAIVLLLAYDQRLAGFLSAMQCALVAMALEQGIGMFVLLLAGCGVAIAQLREVRNRQGLIGATAVTTVVVGIGTVMLGLLNAPLAPAPAVTTLFSLSSSSAVTLPSTIVVAPGAWEQILKHAAWASMASFGVGFITLGLLPSIERMFDITTGMTLAELRDPKQPLLRQLQQKAPGTYNHSLQVANIAEAAADSIDANGLLVYVGALYHDIGKMNKPEYFVENQADGHNKHDKLTPPMSLLVIIGHVKDGVELAREYGLPRQVQHFIESHHGTTLVEYFYHAAKANEDDKTSVDEVEFRYSGPKPRTREAGILMLADAVESATRAMAEPNPARIESLVRELSRKRLIDGQFDQCDLTFRELGLIEEAVINRVCAIHHARISYPSNRFDEPVEQPRTQQRRARSVPA